MDFIERNYRKIRKSIQDAGLKKSMVIYILIAMVTAFFCCIVAIIFLENWKDIIMAVDGEDKTVYFNERFYTSPISNFSEAARKKILVLNWMEIGIVFLFSFVAIVIVSHQYYKKKLEEPFRILKEEMKYISRDDLSFDCSYISGDEMGDICMGFNQMRLQLMENEKNLWQLMKSQRELNAVFAHDIRTPLTVIKGYIQMLLKFYKSGQISEEKLVKTLVKIDHQVDRMERFSTTMKEIHSFEEWEPKKEKIDLEKIAATILLNAMGFHSESIQIQVELKDNKIDQKGQVLLCDIRLIQQVVDNIVINSIRFMKKSICIQISLEQAKLSIYVKDDGVGFSKEALEKALSPYYTTDKEHFGLGLAISQMLCKKHGGNLEIMNSIGGGAIVCAYFYAG